MGPSGDVTGQSDQDRQGAFDRFVVPELGVLLHVARTMSNREHDAEDLVQETLLRAYQSIGRFDGAHPRAWLFTIMRNAEINRTRRQRPVLLDNPETAGAVPDAGARSPEEQAEDHAFDEAVAAMLTRLPKAMARVVELVDIDGLSYAEAAAALDVPVGTVMSRLHRARKKIRDRLVSSGLAAQGGMR